MKKLFFFACICVLLCFVAMKITRDTSTLVRGQMRLSLARDLAQYLVENDYRFPKDWVDYENYLGRSRTNNMYKSSTYSALTKFFSLPWGESLTNDFVLSDVWFKSIDRQRPNEDKVFTREVLFNVWTVSTNRVLVEGIIRTWDENQWKTEADNTVNDAIGKGIAK
jgi:hypothetical protein